MAQFNLADYETVEERIKRFYADHAEGLIITKDKSTDLDRANGVWRFKAEIWLKCVEGQEGNDWRKHPHHYLKATGHAFEVDGTAGANKTSAMENAETSAIGRALANAGYSGNKRASREEMSKVVAAEKLDPKTDLPRWASRNWVNDADVLHFAKDKAGLQALYLDAKKAQVPDDVLAKIVEYGQSLA